MVWAIQAAALSSLVLAVVAHPHARSSEHQLHARQLTSTIDRFRPRQRATYVAESRDVSTLSVSTSSGDYVQVAETHLRRIHPEAEFRRASDNYVSGNGIGRVYFKQTLFGFDMDDADFNVNVKPDGSIFSYGDSLYTGPLPDAAPAAAALINPEPALETVADVLALPITPSEGDYVEESQTSFTVQGLSNVVAPPAGQLVYYRTPEGSLAPAWRIETDLDDHWLTTYLQAEGGSEVLAVTDYIADNSYEVFQWPTNDPLNNRRRNDVLPRDREASPLGWHRDESQRYFETRGNNAIAQPNTDGDAEFLSEPRPESRLLIFRAPFNQAWEPKQYIEASTIQLFYTSNKFRDILYVLGFNEAAGNFQTSNFGRGGVGNDSVQLNTQDGSGLNNANFATPPDGQMGRMRMYVFNSTVPNRDSSFEAGIVVHEYTHGLTNRMTGGPANSRCLNVLESGGMGEGWSDFYATALRITGRDTRTVDYPIGDYATGRPGVGIRAFVYSTNMQTNPYTYSSLNGLTRVHQYGTVWCTMLYEMLWNLIDAHGNTDRIEPSLDRNGIPRDGRYLGMKIVLDALALQPCNPTFVQARNAIVDADTALTGGENRCNIWKAFAKRGLGENAANVGGVYTDDFTVPAGVC
ncbi:hypothetical protein M409DRAFT_66876 [Zasmidium cellare ATCC 36951]|uniref:Extracellular metalloproteinase n=1 Tax=Zasmidium cellare ATCC 36951 TaxID=1080233 RepID=A0A6A6CFD5_ZASCE|nr:uncharacterized protein M409DRAFT_66876 [Zasmidium cellare ATCC 36951]KAF2165924.1 hypothetical protein M409DRAFT_66876 [Zasmidium cellare ATCC 36951]